ncbi:MAG: hypothetical protein KDC66_16665 [Phaeodactylibacter sp.]|nr:hypothetical protein [Phaeodactylibacter sp.]MCB9275127.1 hypothetical protein [Lewinellaceae bacterium]
MLVVIGILIALQINNWNENNKVYIKQKGYLALIKDEMVNNLDALLTEKLALMSTIHAQKKILTLMLSDTTDISEKELSVLMGQAFSHDVGFQYENGALTELRSSGGLKDIANDSIRNMLASWEGRMTRVRLQEKSLYDYWVKCNDYLEIHGDFRIVAFGSGESGEGQSGEAAGSQGNKPILESKEFENKLILYFWTGQTLRDIQYVELENSIRTLIKMIGRELGTEEKLHFYDERAVFLNGRLNPGLSYGIITSGGVSNWASVGAQGLCMAYPAHQEWGILYITIGYPTSPPRPSADLSKYKKLVVELKGEKGGEQVQVAIKDKDAPDDGSEAKFPIGLTNDWKTYEIDITNSFKGADMANLYVFASFEFGGAAPQNVCVRKIYFE